MTTTPLKIWRTSNMLIFYVVLFMVIYGIAEALEG